MGGKNIGKGLGKLQQCILKELYGNCGRRMFPATNECLQKDIQESHWGDVVLEKGSELNRRRASISRALWSLEMRGLIGYFYGTWYLEINSDSVPNKCQRFTVYEELERIRKK